jgi:hypothetical protein
MGFRFRRRVRLAPGLHVNISSHGTSLSIGGRGATLNIGKRGVRETVGIPGTGISYSHQVGAAAHQMAEPEPERQYDVWPLFRFLGYAILAMVVWGVAVGLYQGLAQPH